MATALRTCWDIGETSFQTLLESSAALKVHRTASTVEQGDDGESMPGDELFPVADCVCSWHISIDASPSLVWPWLCQMMRGGGMYGWDALESPTEQSAPYLLADLPAPRLGDSVGEVFRIAQVDPGAAIVWRSCEPLSMLNHQINDLTLAYRISHIEPGRSLLTSRLRCRFDLTTRQVSCHICRLIGLILPVSQLKRIKVLAEASATAPQQYSPESQPNGFQTLALRPAECQSRPEFASD